MSVPADPVGCKTLPKFYQGMLYATVNFIDKHITDPVQKKELYAKLPIHDVTIEEQILYFDSHCDLRKTEQEIYKKLKQEYKANQKAATTTTVKKTKKEKKKNPVETKPETNTIDDQDQEEPEIMYLYKINGIRYWTPDDDLQNGPLYSSVKDQDGDPSPSGFQVGRLKNGNAIMESWRKVFKLKGNHQKINPIFCSYRVFFVNLSGCTVKKRWMEQKLNEIDF